MADLAVVRDDLVARVVGKLERPSPNSASGSGFGQFQIPGIGGTAIVGLLSAVRRAPAVRPPESIGKRPLRGLGARRARCHRGAPARAASRSQHRSQGDARRAEEEGQLVAARERARQRRPSSSNVRAWSVETVASHGKADRPGHLQRDVDDARREARVRARDVGHREGDSGMNAMPAPSPRISRAKNMPRGSTTCALRGAPAAAVRQA